MISGRAIEDHSAGGGDGEEEGFFQAGDEQAFELMVVFVGGGFGHGGKNRGGHRDAENAHGELIDPLGDGELGGGAGEHGHREQMPEQVKNRRPAMAIGREPPGDLGIHEGVDLDGGITDRDGEHRLEHEGKSRSRRRRASGGGAARWRAWWGSSEESGRSRRRARQRRPSKSAAGAGSCA